MKNNKVHFLEFLFLALFLFSNQERFSSLGNLLFGAKPPESSKICQTVIAFTYLVSLNTFLFYVRANCTYF